VKLCADESAALDALRSRLRARFGARLRELTLFGSRARGEGHEDSDLDVAVVIDGLTSAEGREIAWCCGDLLTEHGVIVSTFAVSLERMEELRRSERLIAREIARDGVPL
jgi:predicted nucleotidyltransferase